MNFKDMDVVKDICNAKASRGTLERLTDSHRAIVEKILSKSITTEEMRKRVMALHEEKYGLQFKVV